MEEPISISVPSASSHAEKRPAAAPGPVANGSCAVIGEILPDGYIVNRPEGIKRRFTYRSGRLLEVTTEEGVSHVRREVLEYDERGRLVRTLEAFGDGAHPPGPLAEASSYRYRESGGKVQVTQTSQFGETVECTLDPRAREARCRGSGSGAGPWTSMRRYDGRGRLLAETHDYENSNGSDLTLARTYDDASRTLHETRDFDSDGKIDRDDVVTYDEAGRVVRVRTRGTTTGSRRATWDTSTTYELDAAGRIACATTKSSTDVDGEAPESFTEKVCNDYDASGNIVRLTRARDGANESASFDGTFRNMRCGRFPRPDLWDDNNTTVARQVWDEQLRSMMRGSP